MFFAETADAVFMDAWLPEFNDDHFGTSLVLARSKDLLEIFSDVKMTRSASIDCIGIEKIVSSQQPRINNKRLGLSHRLELCRQWGASIPWKFKHRPTEVTWI